MRGLQMLKETPMNDTALVQKVWNYAHVLRDQGVPYQAYISQISYLLFLKMDEEREGLNALGLIKGGPSALPEDCRWPVLRDLQGEELTRRYPAILDMLSRHSGIADQSTVVHRARPPQR
jgi:type I restriction enzyme M protein